MISQKLKDHYDWMVFGTDPGALLSAAIVARLGLSVCILPFEKENRRRFIPRKLIQNPDCLSPEDLDLSQWSGQWMDPEPHYLLGLGYQGKQEGLIFQCLKKLGLGAQDLSLLKTQREAGFVVTPEYRFELGLNQEDHALEWARELGEAWTEKLGLLSAFNLSEDFFLQFWSNLPRRLKWNLVQSFSSPFHLRHMRKGLQNRLKQFRQDWIQGKLQKEKLQVFSQSFASIEIGPLLEGFWQSLTATPLDSQEKSLFDFLHVLSLQKTGARFVGGQSAYRSWLTQAAVQLGAHYFPDLECKQVFVQKGKFIGAKVSSRGNLILASGGVVGCSYAQWMKKVTSSGFHPLHRFRKPRLPRKWRFTLALTVRNEGIPQQVTSRVLWQEKGTPAMEVDIVCPKDYEHPDSGLRVLYLRTLLPYRSETLDFHYQRRVALLLFRKILELFPGLERHWVFLYPDFRSLPQTQTKNRVNVSSVESFFKTQELVYSEELKEYYSFKTLSELPSSLLVYDAPLGYHTGIQGLCLASSESYPSLGFLGSSVAGLESATWAAHHAGFSGPFSR